MDCISAIILIAGIGYLLWKVMPKKTIKENRFIYTSDVDASLERVQQIRQQIHDLDQLQTEIDISRLDNCYARSIKLSWGSDREYILDLCTDVESNAYLEVIVRRERQRLSTSLSSELSRISYNGEVKTKDKTTSPSRGEGLL